MSEIPKIAQKTEFTTQKFHETVDKQNESLYLKLVFWYSVLRLAALTYLAAIGVPEILKWFT